jgi:ketosteroid isomerase-like protein
MPEESTTPDLVEMIRHVFETFSRRDLEASASYFAPDAVWEGFEVAIGRERIQALWEDYARSAGDLQIELKDVVDYGHGVLLAITNHTGHPQRSEHEVRGREAYVYECSGGLIDHVTPFPGDIDEARAAAERLAESRG